MDSNEEMIQQNMDDEVACDDNVWEHLEIIDCLQIMLNDATERKKGPLHGGSKLVRKKSKPHQRLEGHTMLYNDYFADSATLMWHGVDDVSHRPVGNPKRKV
jgi:hypothetical protein